MCPVPSSSADFPASFKQASQPLWVAVLQRDPFCGSNFNISTTHLKISLFSLSRTPGGEIKCADPTSGSFITYSSPWEERSKLLPTNGKRIFRIKRVI